MPKLNMKPIFSNQIKKASFYIALTIFITILGTSLFLSIEGFPGHKEFKALLISRLAKAAPLPDNFNNSYTQSKNVIYVLGGGQESLKYRFKTAANLYHQGAAKKIFILSRRGITEYDPLLKRNLTKNEWAIKRLIELGIEKKDIEAVSIEEDFFGTLSEANSIPQIAKERGYSNLILVSSSYHTMRVWVSFSEFTEGKEAALFIYGAEDHARLSGLLFEYFKLIIYKEVLL
ncbi:MAG: hypothetical protein A2Z50_06370 [Nitrospirae bacterium RBG_19FT_COMBO_42_15]|nr:MAG: hypothetical protein A2Z50_06370 [Nitrospirae bacterium RBG_19FT_COMBO_42_15]